MNNNQGKPTKSELALLTEQYVISQLESAHNVWTQEPQSECTCGSGRRDRYHGREQALHLVLDFIEKNKRA